MRARPLNIDLDPESRASLVVQIVDKVREAIASGTLKPGDALPSTRRFSTRLSVDRNTVVLAYEELALEGLLVSQPGSGSFVANPLPLSAFPTSVPAAQRAQLGFKLEAPPEGKPRVPDLAASILSCRTGHADPRMLPSLALTRAFRKSLSGRDQERLAHPERHGNESLRLHILELLFQSAGLSGKLDNLLLTNGLATGLRLVAQAILQPGDVVAVETLGSRQHWDVLRQTGATLLPIPVDQEGLQVDQLLDAKPVRAVFLSPRCQYPTTVPLSPDRRRSLLEWASAQGIALIECDADSGIIYDESLAPQPLAAEDTTGCVVYVGSFAKTLFPKLSLAYLHAPAALIAHISEWHLTQEHSPDPLIESAVGDLFREGEFHRHLSRLRTSCLARRDHLTEALQTSFNHVLTVAPPALGMAFWLPVVADLDIDAWAGRSLKMGVGFTKGREFAFNGENVQAIRFGFASHREQELLEIVHRMAQAL